MKHHAIRPITSWQPVSNWYSKSVGVSGDYFHEHIVLPKTLALLDLDHQSSLLDVACGQGVLARSVQKTVYYQGLDIAPSLIAYAREHDKIASHHYLVADVTHPFPIQKRDFTHAAIILALQNIARPKEVLQNVASHLMEKGKVVIVLNHPMFRIPRQSSWGVDEQKKTQYRRIDRYLSPLSIPITAHPGKSTSEITWSFHMPLAFYTQLLREAGFVIETIEEWASDRKSAGKKAKMENRGREEFPLFLAILARKISL